MAKRKRSQRWYNENEKKVMKEFGLTPTIRSGAGWEEKEDGYNDKILAQLKTTDALSYRLTLEDIEKLNYHAMVQHKLPLFIIQFLTNNDIYMVLKKQDLKDICLSLLGVEDVSELKYEPQSAIIDSLLDDGIETDVEIKKIKSNAKARDKFHEERSKKWQNKSKK